MFELGPNGSSPKGSSSNNVCSIEQRRGNEEPQGESTELPGNVLPCSVTMLAGIVEDYKVAHKCISKIARAVILYLGGIALTKWSWGIQISPAPN
jgi:hypothetical protein